MLTVDPATLEIGDNVRDEVDLDATPEFVESIAEHGVLHPILAERRDDGTILVTDGHDRPTSRRPRREPDQRARHHPPPGERTDNARKATRIGQQIVSNDQREALTDGQRAAGIAAMLDLGLSQTAVAKAASVSRTRSRPSRRSAHRRPLAPAWTSISSPSNRPRPSPSSRKPATPRASTACSPMAATTSSTTWPSVCVVTGWNASHTPRRPRRTKRG
ncbi:ParB N-terminal domain-containing protein [Rhodococcus hoagii]|nr:ParB N-terminal domain-containing protein [Prescottella equi]